LTNFFDFGSKSRSVCTVNSATIETAYLADNEMGSWKEEQMGA